MPVLMAYTIIASLVAIVLAIQFVVRFRRAQRRHRADLAQRITVEVPGLGPLTRERPGEWVGEVRGIEIIIAMRGEPPGDAIVARILAIIDLREELINASRPVLERERIDSELPYVLEGIEWRGTDDYSLRLGCDLDPDATVTVRFADGEPVEADFDH
ncbi:MAG: hypothetical protein ACTS3F_13535 [Phycisphaerales bacterium]